MFESQRPHHTCTQNILIYYGYSNSVAMQLTAGFLQGTGLHIPNAPCQRCRHRQVLKLAIFTTETSFP